MRITLISCLALGVVLSSTASAQFSARELAASSIDGLQAKMINVGGIPARYYEAGKGEPLILIHGGRRSVFNSANMWSRNVAGLAEHFHVYAVDRLGYGLTGMREDRDFRYAAEVAFLHAFIETLGLDRVNIAGNSSGGAVALEYGMAYPEKVNTLAIVSVGPQTEVFDKPKGDVMREACGAMAGQARWGCWMSAMTHPPETFDVAFWEASQHMMSLPERQVVATEQLAAPGEVSNFWKERRALWRAGGVNGLPILWVCGSHDVLDWAANEDDANLKGCTAFSHTLGENNLNVKTVIYNQAGHFPYREYPELFNADLKSFIDYWNDQT